MQTIVYMGHPLSGDFDKNKRGAEDWFTFLRSLSLKGIHRLIGERTKVVRSEFKVVDVSDREVVMEEKSILVDPFDTIPIIIAPWLACTVPDGQYPGGRSRAISDCRGVVRIVDEMWQVGGSISSGMGDEARVAKRVRDLTHWGAVPPSWQDSTWHNSELFIKPG